MSVQGGVDTLGEVFEPGLASLELLLGLADRGGAEEVAELELAVPAAESIQALLFLVELGERELLIAELAVDLGLELGALAEELRPLVLAPGGEERFEARHLRLVAAPRVQEQGF